MGRVMQLKVAFTGPLLKSLSWRCKKKKSLKRGTLFFEEQHQMFTGPLVKSGSSRIFYALSDISGVISGEYGVN